MPRVPPKALSVLPPLLRQIVGDPTGRGRAAQSNTSRKLVPRTREADEVVRSVCPYCAVGCAQLVYVKDGDVSQLPEIIAEGSFYGMQSFDHLGDQRNAAFARSVLPRHSDKRHIPLPGSAGQNAPDSSRLWAGGNAKPGADIRVGISHTVCKRYAQCLSPWLVETAHRSHLSANSRSARSFGGALQGFDRSPRRQA